MKKTILCIAFFSPFILGISQVTDAEKQLKTQQADSVYGWKKGGLINLGISQTSLTNWAAGGQSSFSGNGLLNLFAHLKKEKGLWENYLDIGYGMMKQGKDDLQKTDDKIEFTSKYGRNITEKWYLAGLFNFKTQFADGYNYPNDSVKISDLLSPGYFLGAIGADYRPGENFTVFIAPITGRFTVVTDQELSDAGEFGVDPGENVYSEFGGYIRMYLKHDIMKNITFQTKLDLFTNYLNNPQNIDVNWDVLLSMKVNEFISATLSTNLIYDDDIKISFDNNDDGIIDEKGPRVQFKEILAVGFSFKF
jgi:hypothetical protein